MGCGVGASREAEASNPWLRGKERTELQLSPRIPAGLIGRWMVGLVVAETLTEAAHPGQARQ